MPNGAELHLLLNHFPVILPLVGIALLCFGFILRSPTVQKTACWLFVASALFTLPAYFTGEPAERVAKNYPGTIRANIHDHEAAAKIALISLELMGAASLVVLVVNRKSAPRFSHAMGLLLLSVIAFALVARAAHLGGLIRHEEIRPIDSF